MTTEVKCSICGLLIQSNTVTKESYKKGEAIDMGCPYCGGIVPLVATSAKKAKVKKDEPKPTKKSIQ
jgi:hypothetical protein